MAGKSPLHKFSCWGDRKLTHNIAAATIPASHYNCMGWGWSLAYQQMQVCCHSFTSEQRFLTNLHRFTSADCASSASIRTHIFKRRSALKQPAVDGVGGLCGSNIKLIAVAQQKSSAPAEAQQYVPVRNRHSAFGHLTYILSAHPSSKSRWFPMSTS